MKKLIILFSLCMMAVACKEPIDGQKGMNLSTKSYVLGYIYQYELRTFDSLEEYISIWAAEDKLYFAPELIGGVFTLDIAPGNDRKFTEIAERNKDTDYNKVRMIVGAVGELAFADNFSSIEVVCTNAAWDDAHPAGTPLNDLTTLGFTSYADFVKGGYKDGSLTDQRYKLLTELSPTDLHMLSPNLLLTFDPLAAPGYYEILITMTTVDGAKKTTTCPMIIK